MLKAAGYCRVSTDKSDQANSFAAQQQYFREYIQRNPAWELYEIYADEGITGTSTAKRMEFNRMIRDAQEGKFQVILTKEVSRFSRNLLDTVRYTRELKRLGVAVIFMTDGINTMDADAELRLSIMASIAQEESRRTSSRVVWGQTRQMEKGIVFGRSLLGYDVNNGCIKVNHDGAEIIRMIFRMYAVEQKSAAEIARFLTKEGYHTLRGSANWKPNAVVKILSNEKYAGDLVQKKTYTPDYLTHKKQKNQGEVPLIRIENHHEPIVSRELWNLAQERLRKNNKHAQCERGHSCKYLFSGKIKCGECGASFVARSKYRKDGTKICRWSCGRAAREGTGSCCVGKLVRDDAAMNMLKTALQSLPVDADTIINEVTNLALEAIRAGEAGIKDTCAQLRHGLRCVQQKKAAVLDSYFAGELTKGDMLYMKQQYEQQQEMLQLQLSNMEEEPTSEEDMQQRKSEIQAAIASVLSGEQSSDAFYRTILHSLTVFKSRRMELRLTDLSIVFVFSD